MRCLVAELPPLTRRGQRLGASVGEMDETQNWEAIHGRWRSTDGIARA